jgi:tetratricopeptide (TPR) repeat protein
VSADAPVDEDGLVDGTIAQEALRLVGVDSERSRELATKVVTGPRRRGDAADVVTAWRALGLVARDKGDLGLAESCLRKAVTVGRRAGPDSVAEARMTLAFVLLERGEMVAARRLARGAVQVLSGREQARARVQLALVEQRTGALQEALASYAEALVQLRRLGDGILEAKLLNNRGILLAYRGQAVAAERDLSAAEVLLTSLGQNVLAADARWNSGFAAGLRGDSVAALQRFDEAGSALDAAGVSRGVRFLDQAQVLLSVGLVESALEAVTAGIADLSARDVGSDLSEAKLLLAEVLLAGGDLHAAENAAREAGELFVRQGREGFALLAKFALLRATSDVASEAAWTSAEDTAVALARAGWLANSVEVDLLIARRLLIAGAQIPIEMLNRANAATRTGAAGQRLRAWYTIALARQSLGDTGATSKALLAGLRVHDAHRSTLAATELQVHSAARARELAEAGLNLALKSRRPDRVFAWAERWRSGSLLTRPVRPPKDPLLAARLAELRAVSADLELSRLSGADTAGLQRQQRGLERAVASRARSLRSEMRQSSLVRLPELQAALGGRGLIEYIQIDGNILAVVVTDVGVSLHALGDAPSFHEELKVLRFGLNRLALGGSPRLLNATYASVRAAADRLDSMLLLPLHRRTEDRALVLVPTGDMHVLPWALLGQVRSRAVTVAPSASVWYGARERRARPRGHVLVVAGPGLPGARVEASMVAEAYSGSAQLLQPEDATVGAVSRALEGAGYAHLATHGQFRADNPLFSSLTLGNGALTVYDLENLGAAPTIVVLSACDAGLSSVHPGDELMGLTGALLRIGTRSLVASVAPVPDEVAQKTMVALHAALRRGAEPAEALLQARQGLNEEDRIRASAFVCFGAG